MRKLIKAASLLIVGIIAATQISYGQQPVFYDDINYEGRDWHLECGYQYPRLEDFNSSPLGGFYGGCYSGPCNWRVSSIKVPPGCKVTLFDQFNFQGNSITFTTDQPNLLNVGWNDRASSIRINVGPQPQPQMPQVQQRCGGTIYFHNKSGRTVYLYGPIVTKYNSGNFNTCEYFKAQIPDGYTHSIFVPEGYLFNYNIYKGSCTTWNLVQSGIFQDCQCVGQTQEIHF